MGQGSNYTRTTRPKPGDGTQDRPNPERSDANWYGASKEPQEEYIENDPQASRVETESRERGAKTSEGRPTFSRSNQNGNQNGKPDTNDTTSDDPTQEPNKTPVEGP